MSLVTLTCPTCNFEEKYSKNQTIDESIIDKEQFIGIFTPGHIFTNINEELCSLYACPKCNTVVYTDNFDFISIKKQMYKFKKKTKKSNKEIINNEKF